MMRKLFSLLAAAHLCFVGFGGCASTTRTLTGDAAALERNYSPVELQHDAEFLFRTLEDVHPQLYAYTSRERIDSLRRLLERDLTAPLTRFEFYLRVAPIVAELQDGHTIVDVPREEYTDYRYRHNGRAFPLKLSLDSLSGLTIARNYSGDSTLAIGDKIISINGHCADSLAAVFMRGFSSERLAFRQLRCAGWLRALLYYSRIDPPYVLGVKKRESGEQIIANVPGVTYHAVEHIDSLYAGTGGSIADYRFLRLPDNIGYIDFRSMENIEGFPEFLNATFSDIREHPMRGLIVDLRRNGGGRTRLGADLLTFLTDSSFRTFSRKEWKMSAQYKEYMRQKIPAGFRWFPVTLVSAEARRYFGVEDGAIVIDTDYAVQPEYNPLRYRGKTCFLIGSGTFSAAADLANMVGDCKLATLIGEETGGVPTSYGESYLFELPNTKLPVGVSSAFFVRVNGDAADRRGVIPDILVRQTEEDARLGKDSVLEFARRWVLGVSGAAAK